MDVSIESGTEGRARLVLGGRLDAAWTGRLGDALERCVRQGAHEIALDMAGVSFMSSAGLRVLLTAHTQLGRLDGRITVERSSAAVALVLERAGLRALLGAPDVAGDAVIAVPVSAPPEPLPPPLVEETLPPRVVSHALARVEVHALTAPAPMSVRLVGAPHAVLDGAPSDLARLPFPVGTLGLGLGAPETDGLAGMGRLGEFLAVGGAVLAHPAGAARPVARRAAGLQLPHVEAAAALAAHGQPAACIRFDAGDGEMPLTALAALALDVAAAPAATVTFLAETTGLVGAALRRPPDADGMPLTAFPGVRERLTLTPTPSWGGALVLGVGVVARPPSALGAMLRPLAPGERALLGHVHAAVFAGRPLDDGLPDLDAEVARLVDGGTLRAVVHLVHDWRQPAGAGESAFRRGACWVAPLEVVA